MAITLLRAWLAPMSVEDGKWVHLGVGIMALEFILVHSGVMLPAMASSKLGNRTFIIIVVSLLYVLFAVTFALGFKSLMLLGIFTGIMIPRWIGIFTDSDNAKQQQIIRSRNSVMLYLGAVFLSVFVHFPAGGLTQEILDRVYPHRGHGLWERSPQQALVAGAIYFIAIGIVEMVTALRQRSAIFADAISPIEN